ncbi:MAG: hypothetical protein ACI9FR_001937 [Cryomorphaceae bacterium]|jgi:hypothetical protein
MLSTDNATLFTFLADLVLLSHVLVVAFVVFSLLLILLGRVLYWQWVRNPWFRSLHILCIVLVASQAWAGVVCPLTTLEMWLRSNGGGVVYAGSFMAYWLDQILYYDLPAWMFTTAYTLFGLLVLASWFWVKPRPFKPLANQ